MRRMILVSLLSLCALRALAEAPKLEPSTLTMTVGDKKVLTVTPEGTLTFNAQTVVAVDAAGLTVTALKPGTASLVGTNGAGEASNPVAITVVPAQVKITELEKPIVEGETRTVTLPSAIGEVQGPFTLRSEDVHIAAIDDGKVAGQSVQGDQPVTLSVMKGNDVLGTVTVTVLEAVARIDANAFEIEEKASKDIGVKLFGTHNTVFTPAQRPLNVTILDQPEFVTIDANGIAHAKFLPDGKPQKNRVRLTSDQGLHNTQVQQLLTATILVSAGSIVSESPLSFANGGRLVITPVMRDRAGNPLTVKHVDWDLKVPANEKYVTLARTDKTLTLFRRPVDKNDPAPPDFVEITATAVSEDGRTITDTLVVILHGAVIGFAPLKVKLNIMDDQTARDLYGKVAANEYYVTRVRLNNNLRASDDPDDRGASILAFSDSIEVAVRYQKRTIPTKRRDKPGDWQDLTEEDLKKFEESGNDSAPSDLHVDPRCKGFLTYRPYMFEMMVNTVDRRDERSARSKALRILQTVGTAASIVTSVAVPGPQSDIPLAVEKYNSLFLPGFEKLWPTLREINRQNVVSQTMRNIEEIPFGSDLSRVLFFPKREFKGLIPGHETRVASICPYHFNIEVAKIDRKEAVPAGQ